MDARRAAQRSASSRRSLDPARGVVQAREHIDRHFASPLTVPRLAKVSGLSVFHFIRAFRRSTGLTPHQYLRSKRMDRAKELLVTTPMPVTEVCDAVGFQSLGSFSAIFRRLTGESPGAYRAARRRTPYIPTCFVRMYRADASTELRVALRPSKGDT